MKTFITRRLPEAGKKLLDAAQIEYTEWTENRELTKEELITCCMQADALLSIGKIYLDRDFLSQCQHLKVIALLSVGYDHVDINAAKDLAIPICNTPDVLSKATADTAFLLMQAAARKAFYHHKRIAAGEWDYFDPNAGLGFQLDGKTLGIYGMGKIGIEMAKRSQRAFDMPVIYHGRSRKPEVEEMLGARYVSFEELLAESDVLSVHMPLLPETKELFNAAIFRQMKPSSLFINTARGSIHNEGDLIAAINKGDIWGAGLDVTNPEPMKPYNPLLDMPTVAVLPHIGSATIEARNGMAIIAAQHIIAGLHGMALPNEVK